uniref:Uncharacterized protein n=1 Tax=Macrostomum lignano TaxID=282301 RepID=A0A1I8JJG8_9PLAT
MASSALHRATVLTPTV